MMPRMRPEAHVCAAPVAAPPAAWQVWWIAIRPRTLPLAASPVLVGIALAWSEGAAPRWLVALATLLAALLIQIGTNLHNDAADHERGNDRADRLGPLRVTAAGWASANTVRHAAHLAFTLAFVLGVYLAAIGGWPIVIVGLASLAAGVAYSGGPRPISHSPFGELFVLLFFGLVAVGGSHYLQSGDLTRRALLAGFAIGLPAAAVLLINNLRDRAGDLAAGRRTLAAVIGSHASRRLHGALMLLPFALLPFFALRPTAWLALLALPATLAVIRRCHQAEGSAFNRVLADTARAQLIFAFLFAIGALLPT